MKIDYEDNINQFISEEVSLTTALELQNQISFIDNSISIQVYSSVLLFPEHTIPESYNKRFSTQFIAINEKVLSEWVNENSIAEVYRFTIIPTFEPIICVKIWKNKVIVKKGSGKAGFEPSSGKTVKEHKLSKQNWDKFIAHIDKNDFWNCAYERTTIGLDSLEWILEGYKASEYKIINDTPSDHGILCIIGNFILNLSNIV